MSWWSRVPKAYLRRRLLTVLLMWLGISALAFIVGHLAPGDPGYAILSSELERPPTPAKVAALDHTLGLDRPVLVQYYHWLVSALHGNLGHSYQTGQSVLGVPLRLVRTSALEVLGQDYVRTARALGIPETTVVLRHVLRYRVLDPRI